MLKSFLLTLSLVVNNLEFYNILVTPKIVKKAKTDIDYSITSVPDYFAVVLLTLIHTN